MDKIINAINETHYIGTTKSPLEKRWAEHLRDSLAPQYLLHRAILKYGEDHFNIQQTRIDKCNVTSLGRSKHTRSGETKQIIGLANVGPESIETRQRISNSAIINDNGHDELQVEEYLAYAVTKNEMWAITPNT